MCIDNMMTPFVISFMGKECWMKKTEIGTHQAMLVQLETYINLHSIYYEHARGSTD